MEALNVLGARMLAELAAAVAPAAAAAAAAVAPLGEVMPGRSVAPTAPTPGAGTAAGTGRDARRPREDEEEDGEARSEKRPPRRVPKGEVHDSKKASFSSSPSWRRA